MENANEWADATIGYSPEFFIDKLIECQRFLHQEDLVTQQKRRLVEQRFSSTQEKAFHLLIRLKQHGMSRFLAKLNNPSVVKERWVEAAIAWPKESQESEIVIDTTSFFNRLPVINNQLVLDYIVFSTIPSLFNFLLTEWAIRDFVSFLHDLEREAARVFARSAFLTPEFCLFIRSVAFDLFLPFMNECRGVDNPNRFLQRFVSNWKRDILLCPSFIRDILKAVDDEEAIEILYHGLFDLLLSRPALLWAADVHKTNVDFRLSLPKSLCKEFLRQIVVFTKDDRHRMRPPSITEDTCTDLDPFAVVCLNNMDKYIIENITDTDNLQHFMNIKDYQIYKAELSGGYCSSFVPMCETLCGQCPAFDALRRLLKRSISISPVILRPSKTWTVEGMIEYLLVNCGPLSTHKDRSDDFEQFVCTVGDVVWPRTEQALCATLQRLKFEHKQELAMLSKIELVTLALTMLSQRYAFFDRPTESIARYMQVVSKNNPSTAKAIMSDIPRFIKTLNQTIKKSANKIMDSLVLLSPLHLGDFRSTLDFTMDRLFLSAMHADRAAITNRLNAELRPIAQANIDILTLFQPNIRSCFDENCDPLQKLLRLDVIFSNMNLCFQSRTGEPLDGDAWGSTCAASIILAEPWSMFSNVRYIRTFLASPESPFQVILRGLLSVIDILIVQLKDCVLPGFFEAIETEYFV